jgi:hypothetical protein
MVLCRRAFNLLMEPRKMIASCIQNAKMSGACFMELGLKEGE